MKNIFSAISKEQLMELVKSLGQISLMALSSSVLNQALKQSVSSAVYGISNIRTTIKNS